MESTDGRKLPLSNREEWPSVIEEAKVLRGPQNQGVRMYPHNRILGPIQREKIC
jgi:hypothetical protein